MPDKLTKEQIADINKYLSLLKNIEEVKTSKHFLSKLDSKIYEFNNKSKFWDNIKSLNIIFHKPKIAFVYSIAIIISLFSFYSISNINNTNYNKLNDKIAQELNKSKTSNNLVNSSKNNSVSNNYGTYIDDEVDDLALNEKENRSNTAKKYQRIQPVSNSSINSNLQNSQNSNELIASTRKVKNFINDDELIHDYFSKNEYFSNRKDSLLNELKNTNDLKSYFQIKEQIKNDSLKLLKYLNNFQKK